MTIVMYLFTGQKLCLLIVVMQCFSIFVNGKGYHHNISLSLGTTTLANNSTVVITDIGDAVDDTPPLICTTPFSPCCSASANRHGEWLYPNGTMVPNNATGWGFYRGRGDDGTVRLNRRSTTTSPTGVYTCELPLTSSTDLHVVRLYVTADTTLEKTKEIVRTTQRPYIGTTETTATTQRPYIGTTETTQHVDSTSFLTDSAVEETVSVTQAPQTVQLIFRGVSYPNNSVLSLNDIGNFSTGSAILCTTNRRPCCRNPNLGEWYYPDGSMVPNNAAGHDFFRGRGDNQTIWLNRRNNAQSPIGSFCCELPDNSDVNHRVCVTLVTILITSAGNNTAGEQYQLTCMYFGSTTPIFLWTGPPNDSPLPSDTRMVSDVMSSGSTHISILQFNPLQSSHEGNYTCRVVVDTDVEITSIQVNVRTPMLLTTTSEQSTMTERSVSPAEGTAEGVVPIAVGVIVGLLVVVILSVSAVIVVVCIFKRKHSTRNRNKDTSFNMAPNTSYSPAKSSKEMVESEYEDMKTGNEVYEEIPPATVTNVAYGPVQNNDIIITSGTTLYDEVTTPAAATGESQYEAL